MPYFPYEHLIISILPQHSVYLTHAHVSKQVLIWSPSKFHIVIPINRSFPKPILFHMHLSFHWSFTYHFIFSWNNIFMYLSIVHCCSFVKDLSFSIFTNQSILLSYSQKLLKVYILLLILVTLVTPLPFIYCTLFLIFIHISLLFAFFISRLCVIYYVHISFQFISDVRILLHTFILMLLFYIFMKYPKWHVDSASYSHFYALVIHITFISFHVISQSLLFTQQFPSLIC